MNQLARLRLLIHYTIINSHELISYILFNGFIGYFRIIIVILYLCKLIIKLIPVDYLFYYSFILFLL